MAKMWPTYWPYSIYIYICRRGIRLSTFLPFLESLVCPPFCQNLIFSAGRSISRVISLSTFGGHFWPQKVDKLMTLKVDKLMTLWKRYVFPYFGLFGPFFWKTRTLIEKQTGTSVDKLMTFRNSQCYFSVFFCFLIFLFYLFFLVPLFVVFESSSKNLCYVSMLE